jgi:hypothetical protein
MAAALAVVLMALASPLNGQYGEPGEEGCLVSLEGLAELRNSPAKDPLALFGRPVLVYELCAGAGPEKDQKNVETFNAVHREHGDAGLLVLAIILPVVDADAYARKLGIEHAYTVYADLKSGTTSKARVALLVAQFGLPQLDGNSLSYGRVLDSQGRYVDGYGSLARETDWATRVLAGALTTPLWQRPSDGTLEQVLVDVRKRRPGSALPAIETRWGAEAGKEWRSLLERPVLAVEVAVASGDYLRAQEIAAATQAEIAGKLSADLVERMKTALEPTHGAEGKKIVAGLKAIRDSGAKALSDFGDAERLTAKLAVANRRIATLEQIAADHPGTLVAERAREAIAGWKDRIDSESAKTCRQCGKHPTECKC